MVKFLIEFIPVLAFLTGYKIGGIMQGTLCLLIVSIITLITTYIIDRQVNKMNLLSSILLFLSASLTLYSGNSIFIKLKPTIMYFIFAVIFLVTQCQCKEKLVVYYLLGSLIKFREDTAWYSLNFRCMCFFIVMACANEIIWRNFSEDLWVNCKVFGTIPSMGLFLLLQIRFITRNILPTDNNI